MAAVRCAARKLGGSLLQRWKTQAEVAEEGRRLVPSRFMRSRQLSTEVSTERARVIQQKKFELQSLISKAAETQAELNELLSKAVEANDPKAISHADLRLLQHLSLPKAVPEPEPTRWSRCMDFATRASIALGTVAKVTFLAGITFWGVVVIRENGIKPNLFTRKSTGKGKIED